MIGKIVIFALCAGLDALTLKADDPIDSHKNSDIETVASFNAEERMNLVRSMQKYKFEDFMAEHGKQYVKGSDEFKKRAAIFQNRKKETIRLAGLPGLHWIPALNKFMDQTKPEIRARLGYKPLKRKSGTVSLRRKPMQDVPQNWVSSFQVDWVKNMTYSKDFFRDQGACGSCWAVAASAALEAHADVHFGLSVPLSAQQLISCTPNPQECGGKGGCEGATAELAYDYATAAGGLVGEREYKYTSSWGDSGKCLNKKTKAPTVLVNGYTSVPSNNLNALMYAITQGPVVVAVDAGAWSFYGAGVFNSCRKDATLNHAVLLTGYGVDDNKMAYWMIRNSWGRDWGMNGYIKLSRASPPKNSNEAALFCGTDYHPEEGSACKGDTTPVKVCGMCGILYEPVLPVVTGVNKPNDFEAIIADVKSNLAKQLQAEKKRLQQRRLLQL